MYELTILIIVGYILGCIHGSQVIGLYKQVNLKEGGTKNAGASNATLLLGWHYGLIVAIIDIGKAVLSLQIAVSILQLHEVYLDYSILYLLLNGLFVIIGHNYPITMNFNGGKGTASFLGVLLFINWKVALLCLVIALIISFISNYFVLGTMAGYLVFNLYLAYFYGRGPAIMSLFFTILFFLKHLDNFKRIKRDEEMKLRSFFSKEAS